jgi:hypothetical protein
MSRCQAPTLTGTQCLLNAMKDHTLCYLHAESKCRMCGTKMTREDFIDSEGICSYNCKHNGGKSTHVWCSKTADHKHKNSEATIVGYSWHGPIHHWSCVECGFQFGDH